MTTPMEARIRQIATRVFARKGFYGTRMKDIADEADVAVGTIYNYFRSKEDLLLSILEGEFVARMAFLEELQGTGLPVREQVKLLLEQHFATIREKRELAQVLLLERFNRGSHLRDRLIHLQRGIVERIDQILKTGIESGWVRPCNTRVVAQALFDLIQTLSACGMVYSQEETREILAHAPEEISRLIWQGLRDPDLSEEAR